LGTGFALLGGCPKIRIKSKRYYNKGEEGHNTTSMVVVFCAGQ